MRQQKDVPDAFDVDDVEEKRMRVTMECWCRAEMKVTQSINVIAGISAKGR